MIHGVVINKRTYHSGHRMVSGSNAFVLRQKKNQCFWKYTVKLITKPHMLHTTTEYIAHTHTHTRLMALFRDYPGEPVPER